MNKQGKNKNRVVIIGGLITLLAGCKKDVEYSPIPTIEYKSFIQIGNDSAQIAFNFTDGDGDIGSDESNPVQNIFIRYYEKVNGVFQQGMSSGTPTVFTFATKKLNPIGKHKALKGTMKVYLSPFYFAGSSDSDTIKYDIQMVDQADHVSNTVETNEIIRH